MLLKPRTCFYSIFLLLCWLHLGNSAVIAQSECDDPNTPEHEFCTSTPTFEPIFKTATPAPTKNLACPTGLPELWGTVTPDVGWLAQCGHCLASLTPWPTMTPWYTPTPGPSPTAGPSPTPTVTVTPTPVGGLVDPDLWQTVPDISIDAALGQMGSISLYTESCTPQQSYMECYVSFRLTRTSSLPITDFLRVLLTIKGDDIDAWYYRMVDKQFPRTILESSIRECSAGATDCSFFTYTEAERLFTKSLATVGQGTPFVQWNYKTTIPGNTETDFWFMIRYSTIPNFENPTPTPTPVWGECMQVRNWSVDSQPILPVFGIGERHCAGFGPWTLDFSAISWLPGVDWDTVEIPRVEICLREIRFGQIGLPGMVLDLDVLSMVIAAIVFIRWFFR